MGLLINPATGARVALLTRHLIGRAPGSDLRLADSSVSGNHALILWRGDRWMVQDLGSRNGSTLDGVALTAGEARPLKVGSTLGFGLTGGGWTLTEAGPPGAFAESDGRRVDAAGDLLLLPDADRPEVLIARAADGRWVREDDAGATPVQDKDRVRAGGVDWMLHLPDPLPATAAVGGSPHLAAVTLCFAVSLDEEHVAWSARLPGGRSVDLGARSFNYLLLTLARARLEDATDAEVPVSSHGWRYQDELAARLGIEPETMKVHLYRARRQLSGAGIEGTDALVERRSGAGQIRLGVSAVELQTI